MRLGAPLFGSFASPEEWALAHRARGYSAAFCPLGADADDATVRAWVRAAADHDIVIAEVGAWSNPISPDAAEREKALELCKTQLALADRVGARCCVNIVGSRGPVWDGPHPTNLTEEVFALAVDSTREIIDAVQPTRTYYTLETMPWVFPDCPQSYARLVAAIDRERFAVHLDPVNMVNSIYRFYDTASLLRESFALLGPHIRSCHAKDVVNTQSLTLHFDETRPGLGVMDFAVYLRELSKLDPDTPLMIEHLPSEAEYDLAAEHIRGVATAEGLSFG
jgi:sugar phosphate isomerase/epimerase